MNAARFAKDVEMTSVITFGYHQLHETCKSSGASGSY